SQSSSPTLLTDITPLLSPQELLYMRFANKVAIVTGGASGIGAATAALLAREGARVLIADVSSNGESTAAGLASQGLHVAYQQVDVSKEEQISAMLRWMLERWQRLDIM